MELLVRCQPLLSSIKSQFDRKVVAKKSQATGSYAAPNVNDAGGLSFGDLA
jgi:hypothetical protein